MSCGPHKEGSRLRHLAIHSRTRLPPETSPHSSLRRPKVTTVTGSRWPAPISHMSCGPHREGGSRLRLPRMSHTNEVPA
eukprot:1158377-Pyramimonas_sp.AAC.1